MTEPRNAPKTPGQGPTPPARRHEPHITNGAEATNLPPDADMPDLTENQPDEMIERAKKDLDQGQVDTDMRSTPGLDAQQKEKLLKDDDKR